MKITQLWSTLCDPMDCNAPGFPVHNQLPEIAQTHVHWLGDAIQSSHPLSSSSPPAFNLSQHQGLFQRVNSSHQVVKLLEFHFSFRSVFPMAMQDWFPSGWTGLISLLFKGLSRVFSNNSKASVLQCSAFFMIQLSHPYMTTGKTVALTIWTFVSKVMSLLFNMLSRLVITSKESASFNFMAAVTICSDFGAQKSEVCHSFHCFPIYLPWRDGTGRHGLSFLSVEL